MVNLKKKGIMSDVVMNFVGQTGGWSSVTSCTHKNNRFPAFCTLFPRLRCLGNLDIRFLREEAGVDNNLQRAKTTC